MLSYIGILTQPNLSTTGAKKLTMPDDISSRQPAASSFLAAVLLVLLGSSPLTLADKGKFESIDAIKAAAHAFLSSQGDIPNQANTTVRIGNLDTRLTLPSCGVPLAAFLPPGAKIQGKTTIGVRCQTPRPWTLYVPANVITVVRVLVASGSLRRGHIITAADISQQTRDSNLLNRAYLSDSAAVIGKVLKKNLSRKALFTSALLSDPQIIDKGQHVDLQAGSAGLKVSATAIALQGGAVGEKIRVKNLASNKIVEGTILSSGAVQAD